MKTQRFQLRKPLENLVYCRLPEQKVNRGFPLASLPLKSAFANLLVTGCNQFYDEATNAFILPIDESTLSGIISYFLYFTRVYTVTPIFCQTLRELGLMDEMKPYILEGYHEEEMHTTLMNVSTLLSSQAYKDEFARVLAELRLLRLDLDTASSSEKPLFKVAPEYTDDQMNEFKQILDKMAATRLFHSRKIGFSGKLSRKHDVLGKVVLNAGGEIADKLSEASIIVTSDPRGKKLREVLRNKAVALVSGAV